MVSSVPSWIGPGSLEMAHPCGEGGKSLGSLGASLTLLPGPPPSIPPIGKQPHLLHDDDGFLSVAVCGDLEYTAAAATLVLELVSHVRVLTHI